MHAATPRPRWRLAAAMVAITVGYWAALFVATHVPASFLPGGVPKWMDKPEHFAGSALLAVLLCTLGVAFRWRTAWICPMVLAVIALYGLADEWSQSLVPERKPDWRDWVANMSGAGLGIAAFLLGRTLFGTRSGAARGLLPTEPQKPSS